MSDATRSETRSETREPSTIERAAADGLRVLHATNMWPSDDAPHFGVYVAAQLDSLRAAAHAHEVVFARRYVEVRRRVRREIVARRPDVVHAHFGYTAAAVADVCARRGVPLVVSYCGGDINGMAGTALRRIKGVVGVAASLAAGVVATRIVVKSDALLDKLPRALRRKATVLPNGVDTARFAPLERGAARSRLGWDERPVALFAGRREDPDKNWALAEAAVALASERLGDLALRPLEGVPHSDVPLWLNAADVVLMTSVHEGSPNVVKEAMACDTPVVSVPVGDVPWLLEGVAGSRAARADPDSLASALCETLERESVDDGAPSMRGGRAALLEKGLDAASIAERLCELYAAVARVRGRQGEA